MHVLDQDLLAYEPEMGRRSFLKAGCALVALTIISPPRLLAAETAGPATPVVPLVPGVARERIEGRTKVTGQKIYARDFHARHLGWGAAQCYAMYLPALTTRYAFLNLNLSQLPPDAQPVRVVLGNELGSSLPAAPKSLNAEQAEVTAANSSGSFRQPIEGSYDLIVRPGSAANYLGQPVALLVFDSLATYRAARRAMQFRDKNFQIYSPDESQPDDLATPAGTPWPELVHFVKYFDGAENFSFATVDPDAYQADLAKYRALVADSMSLNSDFISADVVVDTQAMDPMFMEPECGLAFYDKTNTRLSVLIGTQSPDHDVASIAAMYSKADSPLKVSEVVLHSVYPGGGFGGRDCSPFSMLLALTAAYSDGKPVQLMYDRFEQFRYGLKRPASQIRGTLVADNDMKLQAIRAQIDFNGGGTRNLSPYVAGLAALCVGGAYEIPAADIAAQSIHSREITGGSQRGFGGPEAFFAIETALDDIAIHQGWDPMALRRANLATRHTRTVVGGIINQDLRLAEVMDAAEAHPLWANRARIKADHLERGQVYGTGLALSMQAYGTAGDGMVAAVEIDPDGRINVRSNAVDMGNGSATTLGVVIGPILGANAQSVEMGSSKVFKATGLSARALPADWGNPHWTQGEVMSSSACLTGLHQVHTVQQTALALMHGSILPVARTIWGRTGIQLADIAWNGDMLVLRDGTRPAIGRGDLARAIYARGMPYGAVGHAYIQGSWVEADFDTPGGTIHLQLDGLSYQMPNTETPLFRPRRNTIPPPIAAQNAYRYAWAPCANVIGLTIDPTTGLVCIENVVSVLNAGRILVPELVSGQSQGGIAMAIGYTLLEDMPDGMAGAADGTWNLDRYRVPLGADVPLRAIYQPGQRGQELICLPETPGDAGAGRGIAEAVMCAVAPAISNALRDAVNKRFTSLPITPAKIMKGLAS